MINAKGEPMKMTVLRILDRLIKFGLVGKNRHGYYLTAKGKDDAYSS
jgi:Mn-dependent DtxR family transcriptional regulator